MNMKLWALLGFTLLLSTSTFVKDTTGQSTSTPSTDATDATDTTNPASTTDTTKPASPTDTTNPASTTGTTNPASTTGTTNPTDGNGATSPTISAPTAEITSATDSTTTTTKPDQQCAGKDNFDPCKEPDKAGCNDNSKCSCKAETFFCRCNNDKDKWYTGENCEQEWTVLTFALVASLPGVGLAAVIGVAVHCAHSSKKKKKPKSSKKNEPMPVDGYSNMVFASDLQNDQKPQPASLKPSHDSMPMASHPYNAYRNASGPSSRNDASLKNPYGNPQPTMNPYNSPDRYDPYRSPRDPPARQNGMAGGTSMYSAPDYSSRQFPRAQVGRGY